MFDIEREDMLFIYKDSIKRLKEADDTIEELEAKLKTIGMSWEQLKKHIPTRAPDRIWDHVAIMDVELWGEED